MNTGQMLLTIGALTLLSIMILNMNSSILSSKDTMYENKFGMLAISLSSSIMETAKQKAFDEKTVGGAINNINSITGNGNLGPDHGEVFSNQFDDFDDYNGFDTTVTNLPSADLTFSCKVEYVNQSNPDLKSNQKTFHKKITVTVTSESIDDSLIFSSIYSYWYFR